MSPSVDVGERGCREPQQGLGPNIAHEPQAVGPEEAMAGRGALLQPPPPSLHGAESLWEPL